MKKVVCLSGDGIGNEIMQSAKQVWQSAMNFSEEFEIIECDFGGVAIDKYQDPLPHATLNCCKNADAILLACVGSPKYDKAVITPEQGLLKLREALGLYCNLRPINVCDALIDRTPLKKEILQGSNFVIVRELLGGIYFGKPRQLNEDYALDTCNYHREAIEKILIQAFEIARTRNKKVVSVDKANVLATSKLWRKIANEVHQRYSDCELTHQYVDSMAMKLISNPKEYDVIVTENLFGDILSDEASVLVGSLGVCPSASLGSNGVHLYEPIHGSAPDIAGKNIANPVGMILSLALMLEYSFGKKQIAQKITQAVFSCMDSEIFTPDLGGSETTQSFTQAVIEKL